MNPADAGAVWQLMQEALHAHAAQLGRDAGSRKNSGEQNKGYRARLREEARLALAIEQIVNSIDPAVLTKLLMISRSRPGEYPGGTELWAVGASADADQRARLWAQAGHPYHPFSGSRVETMCRICTGDRDGPQHQPGEPKPREPFTGLPRSDSPYPLAGQARNTP